MALIAFLITLAGCGAEPERAAAPSSPLREAEARLHADLTATARVLALDARLERVEPAPCDGGDTVTGGYRAEFDAPADALDRAAAYWRGKGWRVRVTADGVFATHAGAAASLQTGRANGRALLSGGTPCVPS